ncbi:neutral ceramidase isoform X2 [Diabrotica virgifera virgifera]|uniref:Neutral ceramidase n=1 Tax=Diabrotica virgifera virgifera TaxID=50390 RepID=A0ABM5L8Q4_DIAVI|nr:neutral ceramidase isoform X2 [Diabrotica virgifera virgifera]
MLSIKILLCMLLAHQSAVEAVYNVGVGRADCTGPSAEITFMGYAKSGQKGCGIHLRQFSRAFVIKDENTLVAFVTIDTCMMNHPLKQAVIDKLDLKYPNVFTLKNTILSGTHSHSTPGGFLKDVMLDIPSSGYCKETFNALVAGIVKSIDKAYNNQVEARIFYSTTTVTNTNRNRSPAAYLYNPESERKKYETDVDKELVQIKFVSTKDNVAIGAINWFPVHPTSMNNTNCLVHSDNVGYASLLLESSVNTDSLPGQGDFVGAFASTNLGDTSPNLKDPICVNTGEPCDFVHSSCAGGNKYCISFGPGEDMFESTKIIANNLFQNGKKLLDGATTDATEITGTIQYIHKFSHMPSQTTTYQLENGTQINVRGCLPAMGYGFAAGTTDGPGEFDFEQATNTSNPFWNVVRDFIFPPTPDDVVCHFPKPILIMSGRLQRYEGASTIYGPYTLPIYENIYGQLTKAMMKNETVNDDSSPYKFPKDMATLITPVIMDSSGWFNNFGDCVVQPNDCYEPGQTVSAVFVAGHPRNDVMQDKTFLTVQKQESQNQDKPTWKTIATDASWETKFIWSRPDPLTPTSQAEIRWEIPDGTQPGSYQIQHFGNYKTLFSGIYAYSGVSRIFSVKENCQSK